MFRFTVILLSVLVLSGCWTRGESRSLDEVLAMAKARYQKASGAGLEGGLSQILSGVQSRLEKLPNLKDPGSLKVESTEIAGTLTELITRSGYPSRPALTELVAQYRALSDRLGAGAGVNEGALKLLVSRTYFLLASELQSTKFKLQA